MEQPENSSPSPLTVKVGSHVKLELVYYNGELEPLEVDIVSDEFADFRANLLGESSALARAVLGQAAGQVIDYKVDDIFQVRILSVESARLHSYPDVARRKQAIIQDALNQSDLTNAIIYASSMNSKWGDYDPSSLEENWNKS